MLFGGVSCEQPSSPTPSTPTTDTAPTKSPAVDTAKSSLNRSSASGFSFFDVADIARSLAAQSYRSPVSNLPQELRDLTYAGYQNIQLRAGHDHWRDDGLLFRLAFYHQGMQFDTPVAINEIDEYGQAHPLQFDPADFDYGSLQVNIDLLKDLGFAGFKVLYPVNSALKPDDELASFLGASYFRVIGRGQIYGLSARGLAIDTALPIGEEFPAFREYWIVKPSKSARELEIYALLDSPRAVGAYRFVIRPGVDTIVDVHARIYLRAKVRRLGIAPLTSMFLYGANQPSPTHNYRPEIHDSEGLAIHTGLDEWVWRPLNNPKRLSISTFQMENPRGFGLLQRTRDFGHYEDLDDRYEKRPSLWIEPIGNWGKGDVQLIEIPTPDETNDNIVAFWVPDAQPSRGTPLDIQYRMTWTLDEPSTHTTPLAWVTQTRRSGGELKGPDLVRRGDDSISFIIDFVGPSFAHLPPNATVSADTWCDDNGEIIEHWVRANEATGEHRLMLRVKVKDVSKPVEMRATLTSGRIALSETWSYRLPANEVDAK